MSFVTDHETPELVDPREGSLDDPAVASCLANGMDRVDGGGERHAVVPVGSRQNEGEWQASPIHHDVALGAGLSTIRRVRPCRVTPFFAGTDEASSEARDQSIRPARFRRSSMWR